MTSNLHLLHPDFNEGFFLLCFLLISIRILPPDFSEDCQNAFCTSKKLQLWQHFDLLGDETASDGHIV